MADVFGQDRGRPALPLRRVARVPVRDLLDIATDLLPQLATPTLRLALHSPRAGEPELHLVEEERQVRVAVADLAAALQDAQVPPTRPELAAALRAWVNHRPATDAQARDDGLAVLDWVGPGRDAVSWRVVVVRGGAAVTWRPSPHLDPRQVRRIQGTAHGRSAQLPVPVQVTGEVAVWAHPTVTLLSTAALAAPRGILDALTAHGLSTEDVHLVVAPPHPVAAAAGPVAARLAEEHAEPSVLLRWADHQRLGWGVPGG